MLRATPEIRYRIAAILAAHWWEGALRARMVGEMDDWMAGVERWIVALHPRIEPIQPIHQSNHPSIRERSELRLCPTCGKHATDVWADNVLNGLLDVPYHHLVLSIPWQLRVVVLMNRWRALNLLARAAKEAIAQWARDVKGMRMGILLVLHTFGADLKWHPHVHLVVTGGGLSLDGKRWIATDPRYLMNHAGLKKRWKYHVIRRMKQGHREGLWRFPRTLSYLKEYRCFGAMLNGLWKMTWYAHIGASLLDPRFSVRYIGRYTKRAVLAEYRITHYDGRIVRFMFKDYAEGGRRSYKTMRVLPFLGRLLRHVPDKRFPMIRYAGLFANRWRQQYFEQARRALGILKAREAMAGAAATWAERQAEYQGQDPLSCPFCQRPMRLERIVFGPWLSLEALFATLGHPRAIPAALLAPT